MPQTVGNDISAGGSMKLRKFDIDKDFSSVSGWISDERTHALWCANRMTFPLEKADMAEFLRYEEEKYSNKALIAEDENGDAAGFFCCSPNAESGECMLKFVIIDPQRRGKGLGRKMAELAAEFAFESENADAVQLMVFTCNTNAKKCYEKAGFTERSTTPDVFSYNGESWGRCNMVRFK